MEELIPLVNRAQAGDLPAYGQLVERFQDMAVGYAYSLLGDFHLAEDAAQEAFLQAYLALTQLKEPRAFASWFRRIVFKHCDRVSRRHQVPVVAPEIADSIAADEKSPEDVVEEHETRDQLAAAIQSLPEHQRLVVSLFYVSAYSPRQARTAII